MGVKEVLSFFGMESNIVLCLGFDIVVVVVVVVVVFIFYIFRR